MESWDDEGFQPPSVQPSVAPTVNKWEGEDEDDNVKESWEDEDEEKKEEEEEKAVTEAPKKPKKKLVEKIAERERQKREELEKRLREQQEEEVSEAEKIRMQQESDLKLALETTFGGATKTPTENLALPETKEQFEQFADSLAKQLIPLSKHLEYPNFVEVLARNLCATMLSNDIRKVKNTLENLSLEKQKIEKGDKPKKNKGKGKAKLKMEGENDLSTLSAYVNDFDDYDDFM